MKAPIKIIGLILLIALSSCEKDESEVYNNTDSGLISQVLFDAELTYEYNYNEANQIVEEKSKFSYTKYNYEGEKLVFSDYYIDTRIFSSNSHVLDSAMNRKEWVNPINTEKDSRKSYFYDNNGKLIKSSVHSTICEFSYDDRDRITRQSFYRDNEKTGYIDFVYDENNNVIKRLHYWILESGRSELRTTTDYEHDNKLNPYKAFNSLMLPGRYTNTNNITKEIYTIHFEVDNTVENVQITENVYKYNAQGYPISKNETVEYKYY